MPPSTEYLLVPESYAALTLSYRNYALRSNDLVTDLLFIKATPEYFHCKNVYKGSTTKCAGKSLLASCSTQMRTPTTLIRHNNRMFLSTITDNPLRAQRVTTPHIPNKHKYYRVTHLTVLVQWYNSNPLQPPPFSNHPQHGTSSGMDTRRTYYPPPPPPAPVNQPDAYYPSHHPSGPSPHYAINSHSHIEPQTLHAHSGPQQFIPTPSQTYQVYSSTVPSNSRSRPTIEPYYHMSPNPQHATQGSSSPAVPRPVHHTSPTTNPALIGDRFPCELCDRSFTRSHDRRRHYETVHATTPVLHRCRYCGKDFSRADSLKRHIDNGCDEMSHK
ncbi:hypothetical protein BD769DRAFT_1780814 [Suillus cothurnatus]|nr:hypothetical protein BD769DRAFT_1780814 [Suillus cothurnatus]